jgi:peptidoglycan/LPS O-acetylase OafA/YrhL
LDLRFADGLRALAALTVALFHTYMFTGETKDHSGTLAWWVRVVLVGDFAVPVFIVLSGFVLMLPVARSAGLELRGGTITYLRRRARRILPPYFASLLFFLVLIAAIPLLQHERGTAWDSKIPVTWEAIVSHVLVIQNAWPGQAFTINGPAWSVATEWQLYFAMPLLLVLWRRLGLSATLIISVAVGWAIHFLIPSVDGAHYWFLGLFAMGMAAAWTVVQRVRIPLLGPVIAVAAPLYLVGLVCGIRLARSDEWLSETGLGIVIALTLVWLGQRSISGMGSWLHTILESRPLVWMGLWSYSLYLIHSPLLGLGNLILLDSFDLTTVQQAVAMVAVVLPSALAVAYVFHRLVERRFLTSHQQQVEKTDHSGPLP